MLRFLVFSLVSQWQDIEHKEGEDGLQKQHFSTFPNSIEYIYKIVHYIEQSQLKMVAIVGTFRIYV